MLSIGCKTNEPHEGTWIVGAHTADPEISYVTTMPGAARDKHLNQEQILAAAQMLIYQQLLWKVFWRDDVGGSQLRVERPLRVYRKDSSPVQGSDQPGSDGKLYFSWGQGLLTLQTGKGL